MKKVFTEPKLEVIYFTTVDIITSSGMEVFDVNFDDYAIFSDIIS